MKLAAETIKRVNIGWIESRIELRMIWAISEKCSECWPVSLIYDDKINTLKPT